MCGEEANRVYSADEDQTACAICGCPEVRWLRVGTVAGRFACSPKRVRRMLKGGELDGVLFGGEWRIDHRSLDDYVRRDSVRFLG